MRLVRHPFSQPFDRCCCQGASRSMTETYSKRNLEVLGAHAMKRTKRLAPRLTGTAVTAAVIPMVFTGAAEAFESAERKKPTQATTLGTDARSRSSQEENQRTDPSILIRDDRFEAAADVLHLGRQQRVVLEGKDIAIYDHPAHGGALLHKITGAVKSDWPTEKMTPSLHDWVNNANYKDAARNGVWGSTIAVSGDGIFVTDPQVETKRTGTGHVISRNHTVTSTTVQKYQVERSPSGQYETRTGPAAVHAGNHVVTRLASGNVNGEDVIVMGLNHNGIRIHKASDLKSSSLAKYELKHLKAAVVSLAVGTRDDGRQMVAFGQVHDFHVAMVDATTGEDLAIYRGEGHAPTSLAFGKMGPDDKQFLGVGYVAGKWKAKLLDPMGPHHSPARSHYTDDHPGAVHALTFFEDAQGEKRLAVSRNFDANRANVLKRSDSDIDRMEAVEWTDRKVDLTHQEMREAGSGFWRGRLLVENATKQPVDAYISSANDGQKGCWVNPPGKKDSFPAGKPVVVEPGKTSPEYAATPSTLGSSFDCLGKERSMYVTVTKKDQPGSRQVAKVTYNQQNGKLAVDSADGSKGGNVLAVQMSSVHNGSGDNPLGTWKLKITDHGEPSISQPPKLEGKRLTAAPSQAWLDEIEENGTVPGPDDPRRPVYRFDVPSVEWKVPGAANNLKQSEVEIPNMTAEGSTDGGRTWKSLGIVQSVGKPQRSGDRIILTNASFFLQNEKEGNQYTSVRVKAGDATSEEIQLNSLQAPKANNNEDVGGLTVHPLSGENTKATPRANGMDQAPLEVAIQTANHGAKLPSTDERYGLIYYRDKNKQLITGLHQPNRYTQFTGIGMQAGSYSNEGNDLVANSDSVRHYLTSTNPDASQTITARLVNQGTDRSPDHSGIGVAPRMDRPSATGTGKQLRVVSGNAAGVLRAPTDKEPALYQAGSQARGPVTGLLLEAQATTGQDSLPLPIRGSQSIPGGGKLVSAPVRIDNMTAEVPASHFNKGDTINTSLVSQGDRVEVNNVPVE